MASKRRSTKKAGPSLDPTDIERHPLERYEMVEMRRTELKDAPYNPRFLGEKARKKLKRGIKKLGLLAPITWNKRTGNMVGGHQRLKMLDQLAGGVPDYTLSVAVVDLSEREEREANLLLNNPDAMGEWDLGKFQQMLKDQPDLDLDSTGFDQGDIYKLFGGNPFGDANREALDGLADQFRQYNDRYEERIRRDPKGKRDEDFYFVAVFKGRDERRAFTTKFGLGDERYQNGDALAALIEGTTGSTDQGLLQALANFAAGVYRHELDEEGEMWREELDKTHPDWMAHADDDVRGPALEARGELQRRAEGDENDEE